MNASQLPLLHPRQTLLIDHGALPQSRVTLTILLHKAVRADIQANREGMKD